MIFSPRRLLASISVVVCLSLVWVYYHGIAPARAAAARAKPKPPPAQPAAAAKAGALLDIAYTKPADAKNRRRQTLDLYLPAKTAEKPPLVIFIHGGFWTL